MSLEANIHGPMLISKTPSTSITEIVYIVEYISLDVISRYWNWSRWICEVINICRLELSKTRKTDTIYMLVMDKNCIIKRMILWANMGITCIIKMLNTCIHYSHAYSCYRWRRLFNLNWFPILTVSHEVSTKRKAPRVRQILSKKLFNCTTKKAM
jgi:hypothetical protein